MTAPQRQRIVIEGIVQGVGFRPFVYRCARSLGLAGWVRNDGRGVTVEAEGPAADLSAFLWALRTEAPPLAAITRLEAVPVPATGEAGFAIRASGGETARTAQVAPDGAVCPECLRELFDPADRRYRYPFINCTDCGPRYTIVTAIPYDRPHTTMADFPLCPLCRAEYDDPASRRFHAQPNACPACGPRLRLIDGAGRDLGGPDPVAAAAELLRQGAVVAVKGLGGYHLAADAESDAAVRELRRRKARDEKPFALMSAGLAQVRRYALFAAGEERLLGSPERPIVLLRQRADHPLSPAVAPRNRYFGVMLPYTPLHHLLLEGFTALVMTSGNLSDEPIAFTDADALGRLRGLADAFLVHDRRIHIRADDSIARLCAGKALLLRRSRGYVPRAVLLPRPQPPTLALGAELKSAVCLTRDERAVLSQHLGDLGNPAAVDAFAGAVAHLRRLLEIEPVLVAHDLHPDYASTRFAEELPGVRRVAVQHHHAHLASCLAENGAQGEAIGVVFDGLGYGEDGRLWGGEFLVGGYAGCRRAGRFAYLPMPGGDAATREPWRMAVSALAQACGGALPPLPLLAAVPGRDLRLLLQMIEKGVNTPLTSSCGRLFDAVAALCGLRSIVSYEGQAALELEMALGDGGEEGAYPFEITAEEGMLVFQSAPLVRAVAGDVLAAVPVAAISARFHNALAAMVAEVCRRLRQQTGLATVALSGGVFQNLYLTERTARLLRQEGFTVLTHSLVPPNDGGLALGQAVIAGHRAET